VPRRVGFPDIFYYLPVAMISDLLGSLPSSSFHFYSLFQSRPWSAFISSVLGPALDILSTRWRNAYTTPRRFSSAIFQNLPLRRSANDMSSFLAFFVSFPHIPHSLTLSDDNRDHGEEHFLPPILVPPSGPLMPPPTTPSVSSL